MAEGKSREVCIKRHVGEDKDCLAHSFYSNVLLGKLHQADLRATRREGGVGLFSRGTSDQIPGNRWRRSSAIKNPGMHVPSMENPTCAAFEEYEVVPETMLLDF